MVEFVTHDRGAVVSWAGLDKPIILTLYAADGEMVAVPLVPKRALTLPRS